jgi:hypothetical protein
VCLIGDGYCDDGTWGLNLNCEEWDFDGGDCSDTNCESGYVDDCSGDGDCCPESWIGDGFADCEDQAWGCDLTCYNNDGGDCGGSESPGNDDIKILSLIQFLNGDGYRSYSFNDPIIPNAGKAINPLQGNRDYVLIAATSQTNYLDSDVINGIEFCYHVTAVNVVGESEPSNIVCATPMAESVADVELGIGNLELNIGEIGSLDLSMNNEDPVSGFHYS